MKTFQLIRLIILPGWAATFKLVTLSVFSIMLGVALIVSVFNANESIIEQFNYSNGLIQGKQSARLQSLNGAFKETDLSPLFLRQLQNFDFTPVLERKVFDVKSGQVLTILGVDLLNDYRFRQYAFNQKNPKLINLIDPASGAIILSKEARNKLAWKEPTQKILYGSKEISLSISDVSLKNLGIAKADEGLIALADLSYLQKLLTEEGNYTSLEFLNAKPEKLKADLALPAGFRVLDPGQRRKEIGNLTSAFRFNLQALSFIALLVAAYLIFQTVFISFQRKSKLIGIIRVLGFTPKQTFYLLWLESFLLGLIGVALGCLLGLFLSKFVLGALQKTVNELYFSTKSTALLFSFKGLIIGSLTGISVCCFAGLPSALFSLNLDPAANLRSLTFRTFSSIPTWSLYSLYSLGGALLAALILAQDLLFNIPFKYVGFGMAFLGLMGLSLLSGLLLNANLKIFSGMNNWFGKLFSVRLSANYIRLWIATGALICGLSMTISISVMIESFRETVKDWINDTLKADVYISSVYPNEEGLNPSLTTIARTWPEVRGVDALSKHKASLNDKPVTIGGTNLGLQLNSLRFTESLPDFKNKILNSTNYVLISNTLAIKHQLKPGESFSLETFKGNGSFKVAAVYQDYSSEHGYILMPRETYIELFRNSKISNIALYLQPGRDGETVKTKLALFSTANNTAQNALKIQTNRELRKTILKIFDQTFQISYLFFWIALFIAIMTVSLTLFSCIEENAYFNLVNRYLGTSLQQLLSLEIGQGLLITVVALIMSIPGGYWLSYVLRNTVNNNSFGWIIYLHPQFHATAFIALLAIVGALIGSIYPIFAARRMIVSNASVRELS
jgi:putative ABC transport system permease protein